jgi:hypothetical protein
MHSSNELSVAVFVAHDAACGLALTAASPATIEAVSHATAISDEVVRLLARAASFPTAGDTICAGSSRHGLPDTRLRLISVPSKGTSAADATPGTMHFFALEAVLGGKQDCVPAELRIKHSCYGTWSNNRAGTPCTAERGAPPYLGDRAVVLTSLADCVVAVVSAQQLDDSNSSSVELFVRTLLSTVLSLQRGRGVVVHIVALRSASGTLAQDVAPIPANATADRSSGAPPRQAASTEFPFMNPLIRSAFNDAVKMQPSFIRVQLHHVDVSDPESSAQLPETSPGQADVSRETDAVAAKIGPRIVTALLSLDAAATAGCPVRSALYEVPFRLAGSASSASCHALPLHVLGDRRLFPLRASVVALVPRNVLLLYVLQGTLRVGDRVCDAADPNNSLCEVREIRSCGRNATTVNSAAPATLVTVKIRLLSLATRGPSATCFRSFTIVGEASVGGVPLACDVCELLSPKRLDKTCEGQEAVVLSYGGVTAGHIVAAGIGATSATRSNYVFRSNDNSARTVILGPRSLDAALPEVWRAVLQRNSCPVATEDSPVSRPSRESVPMLPEAYTSRRVMPAVVLRLQTGMTRRSVTPCLVQAVHAKLAVFQFLARVARMPADLRRDAIPTWQHGYQVWSAYAVAAGYPANTDLRYQREACSQAFELNSLPTVRPLGPQLHLPPDFSFDPGQESQNRERTVDRYRRAIASTLTQECFATLNLNFLASPDETLAIGRTTVMGLVARSLGFDVLRYAVKDAYYSARSGSVHWSIAGLRPGLGYFREGAGRLANRGRHLLLQRGNQRTRLAALLVEAVATVLDRKAQRLVLSTVVSATGVSLRDLASCIACRAAASYDLANSVHGVFGVIEAQDGNATIKVLTQLLSTPTPDPRAVCWLLVAVPSFMGQLYTVRHVETGTLRVSPPLRPLMSMWRSRYGQADADGASSATVHPADVLITGAALADVMIEALRRPTYKHIPTYVVLKIVGFVCPVVLYGP